jgi:uncharacterized protein (TIGR03067 family)
MRRIVLSILAAGFLVAAAPAPDDAVKKEMARLEGTWSVKALTVDGKQVPEEDISKLKVVLKGDTYTLEADGKVAEEGTWTIDPTKKPKTIDTTPKTGDNKGKPSQGIYQLDGDTLKMCFGPTGKEDRPKEFESKEGTKYELGVYKREKP